MARIDFDKEHKRRESTTRESAERAGRELAEELEGALRAGVRRVRRELEKTGPSAERKLVKQAGDRRQGMISHLVAYLAVITLLLVVAGFVPALAVGLMWGIGLVSHGLDWQRWQGENRSALERARQVLEMEDRGDGRSLPEPQRAAEEAPEGVAGDLMRACQQEAQAVVRMLSLVEARDPARAAEVHATVKAGIDRMRELMRHRAAMEPLLHRDGLETIARDRADTEARLAATRDAATQNLYRQSLEHLAAQEAGLRDLHAGAERLEAQAKAFAAALKAMQVDLLRLQGQVGSDEPTSALHEVTTRARSLSSEVEGMREMMDEVAQARRERQSV